MICKVCGYEYKGSGICPACGFQPIGGYIGGLTPEIEHSVKEAEDRHRQMVLGDISVYSIGYIMQEKDGKIELDSSVEIPLAEKLDQLDFNRIYWSNVEYGKSEPGGHIQIDIIIKKSTENNNYSLKTTGPATEGFWKLGFILKHGLEFSVVVGDEKNYSETDNVSLK